MDDKRGVNPTEEQKEEEVLERDDASVTNEEMSEDSLEKKGHDEVLSEDSPPWDDAWDEDDGDNEEPEEESAIHEGEAQDTFVTKESLEEYRKQLKELLNVFNNQLDTIMSVRGLPHVDLENENPWSVFTNVIVESEWFENPGTVDSFREIFQNDEEGLTLVNSIEERLNKGTNKRYIKEQLKTWYQEEERSITQNFDARRNVPTEEELRFAEARNGGDLDFCLDNLFNEFGSERRLRDNFNQEFGAQMDRYADKIESDMASAGFNTQNYLQDEQFRNQCETVLQYAKRRYLLQRLGLINNPPPPPQRQHDVNEENLVDVEERPNANGEGGAVRHNPPPPPGQPPVRNAEANQAAPANQQLEARIQAQQGELVQLRAQLQQLQEQAAAQAAQGAGQLNPADAAQLQNDINQLRIDMAQRDAEIARLRAAQPLRPNPPPPPPRPQQAAQPGGVVPPIANAAGGQALPNAAARQHGMRNQLGAGAFRINGGALDEICQAHENEYSAFPDYVPPAPPAADGSVLLSFPRAIIPGQGGNPPRHPKTKDVFFREQAAARSPFIVLDRNNNILAISDGVTGQLHKHDGTPYGPNEPMVSAGVKLDGQYGFPDGLLNRHNLVNVLPGQPQPAAGPNP